MIRNMFGDNMSVILKSSLTSSNLKINSFNAIEYQIFRDVVAAGFIKLEHIVLENNYADILTKSLNRSKQYALCKVLIFMRIIWTKNWRKVGDSKAYN